MAIQMVAFFFAFLVLPIYSLYPKDAQSFRRARRELGGRAQGTPGSLVCHILGLSCRAKSLKRLPSMRRRAHQHWLRLWAECANLGGREVPKVGAPGPSWNEPSLIRRQNYVLFCSAQVVHCPLAPISSSPK